MSSFGASLCKPESFKKAMEKCYIILKVHYTNRVSLLLYLHDFPGMTVIHQQHQMTRTQSPVKEAVMVKTLALMLKKEGKLGRRRGKKKNKRKKKKRKRKKNRRKSRKLKQPKQL